MPKPVEDTPENVAICKQFCGQCPTMKENMLVKHPPMMLFCSRGKSEKPDVVEKACTCFGCGVFLEHELEGAWFCTYGVEGKK